MHGHAQVVSILFPVDSSEDSSDGNGEPRDLQVHVDGEIVVVKIQEKDTLISIAHQLKEMGHNMDLVLPHIRIGGQWVSESERLDTRNDYHFCE